MSAVITPNGRYLGRKPDSPDPRDRRFLIAHPEAVATPLPPSVDLRNRLPACFDQGNLGSCTANAGAGLMSFLFPAKPAFSRLQIYYDTRDLEGDIADDSGGETRDVMKALQQDGAAPESEWPYDVAKFADPLSAQVVADATQSKLGQYSRLSTENEFLLCLASEFPYLLGFECPDYIDSDAIAAHGVFWLPGTVNPTFVGGHDVLIVGYDLHFKSNPDFLASGVDPTLVQDEALMVRNSWGTSWGIPDKPGHFWMPMSWASNTSTGGDSWTGRLAAPTATKTVVPTIDGIPAIITSPPKGPPMTTTTSPMLTAEEITAATPAVQAALDKLVPKWKQSLVGNEQALMTALVIAAVGAVDIVRNNQP